MANFANIIGEYTDASAPMQTFTLRFDFSASGGPNVTRTWTTVGTRSAAYQITTIGVTDAYGQFVESSGAIASDIASDGTLNTLVTVSTPGNQIKLEATQYGAAITEVSTDPGNNLGWDETPEVLPTKDFQLESYILSPATTNPACSHVKVEVTCNADGVGPFQWVTPNLPTETVGQVAKAEVTRTASNQTIDVTIEDSESDQATIQNVIIPKTFTAADITSITVVTNPDGLSATVTAFVNNPGDVYNLTYSIDGTNFQSSNVFPSVLDGNYTLYVNDGYGCIASDTFVVDTQVSIERRQPYTRVPEANSFRFISNETKLYNTLENTLNQFLNYRLEYNPFYGQTYQRSDGVIKTQFRSNYDTLTAEVVDCDGQVQQTPAISQKSNNLDARQKMDMFAFNLGAGQTGIYFTEGNYYDPVTDEVIETYALNGNLPEWGVVGNIVTITGDITGQFVIKQVKYDYDVRANILVIDYTYTSGNESLLVVGDCTYDRLNYEVYEFDVDFTILAAGVYTVRITNEDSLAEYATVIYNSEYIDLKETHQGTFIIEWADSPYTGIDYTTGFTGKLRLKGVDPYYNIDPGGEITAYKDTLFNTEKLKDVPTMEGLLQIIQQPRFMVEKMRIVLSHESITINGEPWTNEEPMETVPFERSNIFNMQVSMRRQDYEQYQSDFIDLHGDL